MKKIKYVSLFSGIEAASVAFKPLDWEPVAFSEVAPFPCAVLAHHYPHVPNLGDINQIDWKTAINTKVDLVIGGFPCQSFSVVNHLNKSQARGLDAEKGQLFYQYVRAIDALSPRWTIGENVPGLINDADFPTILGELCGNSKPAIRPVGGWDRAGFLIGEKRAIAWRIFDSKYFGVPQRRRRVYFVGFDIREVRNLYGTASPEFYRLACLPAKVLFEWGSPTGNRNQSSQKEESREDELLAAQSLRSSQEEVTAVGFSRGQRLTDVTPIAPTLKANQLTAVIAFGTGTRLTDCVENQSPTLTAKHPMATVAFGSRQALNDVGVEISPTLRVGGAGGGTPIGIIGFEHDSYSHPRNLTPIECERLNGFPDNYTRIQYKGKEAGAASRCKTLGNTFTVPVINWIGSRINQEEASLG
jgi:DNA (cytosine-5)-methyltransferase 1